MNNHLHLETFVFDESGKFLRFGDYLADSVTEIPFCLQADGIANLDSPVVSCIGNERTISWRETKGKHSRPITST